MSADVQPVRSTMPQGRPVQRYPRALLSVPVMLRHLGMGGIRLSRGISLDISEGGLGAIVTASLRVGEMVEIEVSSTCREHSAVAIVSHCSQVRSGFEYVGLTQAERQQIGDATGHA
jgi:hypothetical protein